MVCKAAPGILHKLVHREGIKELVRNVDGKESMVCQTAPGILHKLVHREGIKELVRNVDGRHVLGHAAKAGVPRHLGPACVKACSNGHHAC